VKRRPTVSVCESVDENVRTSAEKRARKRDCERSFPARERTDFGAERSGQFCPDRLRHVAAPECHEERRNRKAPVELREGRMRREPPSGAIENIGKVGRSAPDAERRPIEPSGANPFCRRNEGLMCEKCEGHAACKSTQRATFDIEGLQRIGSDVSHPQHSDAPKMATRLVASRADAF
jgi:hypothetical protein